jgi:hypothetical protein
MNQFFYESRGKEKIRELMDEGMRSQAVRRTGASRAIFRGRLTKAILVVLVILAVLALTLR